MPPLEEHPLIYSKLTVTEDVRFAIAIGVGDGDPISRAIAERTFSFPPSFRLLLKLIRPGQTVIDLGAHIGTLSLAAAALGCQVLAVEAAPYNAALLNASALRNHFERLKVIWAAVSDRSGVLEFVPAGPYGVIANPATNSSTIQVPAITVDGLLAELGWDRVDWIKMDVEGSEIAAIRGMSRLLARADAPPIVYESNGHTLSLFNETPNRLLAALEELGYRNYLVEPGRLVPVRAGDLQAQMVTDYLAIRQLPAALPGWRIQPPLTLKQTVSRILSSIAHPNEHNRAYIGRALTGAHPSLLSNRRIKQALDCLSADPIAEVRAAVSWWAKTTPAQEAASPTNAGRGIAGKHLLCRWRRLIQRQIAFDRRLIAWPRQVAATLAAFTQRQTGLETHVETLEVEAEALTRRLDKADCQKEH
jgi:FkbM family methyltransferase